MNARRFFLLFGLLLLIMPSSFAQELRLGNERMDVLLPLLQGKRTALMVNQASKLGSSQTHLVDTLLAAGVQIVQLFVPEHGLRGDIDAGKSVRSGRDSRTGLPIISLYGRIKRPTPEMLRGVDVIVFDLQDVGTRFYTYISSMHYLMETAAEQSKHIIILDRPNPNDYIDGSILEPDCRSFVGMHPIPIVHGLTVGELAQMINGERWLRGGRACNLTVVPILGWRHGQTYSLPTPPSPNLPNDQAVALYPSLCLFEGTIMSMGRGTDAPFQVLGYPNESFGRYTFTPEAKPGADSNPVHKGRKCYGIDLRSAQAPRQISLKWLIEFSRIATAQGLTFINRPRMFDLLAGTKRLAPLLQSGASEADIRATWAEGLEQYRLLRRRYLLYPDY